MYMTYSGNSHIRAWVAMVRIVYICTELPGKVQVCTGMTGDINMLFRTSTTNLWEEDISRDFLRFGFLICMVIGGQGCPQILVILYWLRGQGCLHIW
jgi:hypothetical protein